MTTTLHAKVQFSADAESVKRMINSLQNQVSKANIAIGAPGSSGDPGNDKIDKLNKVISALRKDTSVLNDKPEQKFKTELLGIGANISKSIATGLIGLTKKSFEVLQSTYNILKKHSPLLQAVESLFNLAMQIFFMPLGNKLGEVLIPAVVQLLEDVTSLWEEYGDGGLGEIFEIAISKGVDILANFFHNIGDALEKEGGFVGDIGRMVNAIGSFVEKNLVNIVELVLKISTAILSNLPLIIRLIGTFMTTFVSLTIAQIMTIVQTALGISKITAGTVAAVGIAAAIGGGIWATETIASGMAEGGYVPPTPGGQLHTLGEGGEGEYVIPESKLSNLRGNNVYNFYGLTDSELEEKIRQTVSDQVAQSRMRGSF